MRILAKALPCLLLAGCIGAAMPCMASARPAAVSGHQSEADSVLSHAYARAGVADDTRTSIAAGRSVAARKRAKAAPAAPRVAKAEPHDPSNRFRMTQDGKQMTADDFDAWMKSRGFRVAKGGAAAKTAD